MAAPKKGLSSVSLIFACGTALFSDGYANGVIGNVNTRIYSYSLSLFLHAHILSVLKRVYGKAALSQHNYSNTLTSVGFAGTVVGMLSFGYLSDKLGRKFGMMSATGIVALFSFLSACSSGAHGSIGGLLAMLSACR